MTRTKPTRLGAVIFVALAMILFPQLARALPSFALQTGQACASCHIGAYGPQLTAFGRAFKLGGYTQKGGEEGGFILAGDDGSTWELSGKTVKLDEHVGHKVKLTGTPVHGSKAHEATMEANEKKESGGKEYADLKVTRLKMVSDSCK